MSADDNLINFENLPSPPSVAIKLLELFDDPDADIAAIGKVIQVDPALTSKIISYCNSPLFGRSQSVDSINRAIVLLGLKAVKMISLSFSLVDISSDKNEFDYSSFWRRSLALAVASKALATVDKSAPEKCFLIGLMQNIGELALYQDPEAHPTQIDIRQVQEVLQQEQQQFDTNRYAVACQILEEWNFPEAIISELRQISLGDQGNLEAVRRIESATGLAAILTSTEPSLKLIGNYKDRFWDFFGGDEQMLEELFESAFVEWQSYAKLLEFECVEGSKTLREIEFAAKQKMTEVALSQSQDQLRIEAENKILKSNAGTDVLTGVGNRQAYEEYATKSFSRCRRTGSSFSLLVVDIDHFKNCNDTYGHQVGDEALKLVACKIQQSLRDYDILYRYGGEEFVVTLPECDGRQAMKVAERLRQGVAEAQLIIDDQTLQFTVSIGVVTTTAPYAMELTDLFELGDQGLYQAKRSGRNCCIAVDDRCAV